MLRKLSALVQSDTLGLFLASAAIGWGLGRLQQYVDQRQAYLGDLESVIGQKRRELAELEAPLSPAPMGYPSREDLNPLNNGVED